MIKKKVTLGLGTVQWNQKYGLGKNNLVPSNLQIRDIIKLLLDENIECLDTSQNYGNVEQLIGSLVGSEMRVITKISILTEDLSETKIEKNLHYLLNISRKNLCLEKLDSVLIHNTDFLKSKFAEKYLKVLFKFKKQGLVNKIGFSVYELNEVKEISKLCDPDILQIPLNVFNQKFLECMDIKLLKQKGCEIHARSIFLQGLLLHDVKDIPLYFRPYEKYLNKWNIFCLEQNVSQISACFDFIKNSNLADVAIIGVNSKNQLLKNIAAFKEKLNLDYTKFSMNEVNLIDPRVWKS